MYLRDLIHTLIVFDISGNTWLISRISAENIISIFFTMLVRRKVDQGKMFNMHFVYTVTQLPLVVRQNTTFPVQIR